MDFEFIYILVMGCYILLLIIGVYIFIRMIKTKLYNLFGLSMFFIIYSLTFFSQFISPSLVYPIVAESCLIFLLIFIEETFYKGLKSPFLILLVLLIILKIIDSVFRIVFGFQIPLNYTISSQHTPFYYMFAVTISFQITITMIWFFISALKSYKLIKNFDIEPWIKTRYLFIMLSSFSFGLNGIIVLLLPIEGGYGNIFFTYAVAATIIIFSFGNLFGWLMPQKLKKLLNRDYNPKKDEVLSEKELLQKIQSELNRGDNSGDN